MVIWVGTKKKRLLYPLQCGYSFLRSTSTKHGTLQTHYPLWFAASARLSVFMTWPTPKREGCKDYSIKPTMFGIVYVFFLILRNSFLQIKFTFFFGFFTALYLFSDRFIIHLYYIGSIIIQSYPPLFISEKLKENDLIIQSSH